ncbi:hypothetical protein IBI24_001920 [Campylobacter coli]|nr:hypothetical protein [Campylobacter coli]
MKLKDFDFRIWDNIEKKYVKTPHGLYIENTEHNDASNCNRIIANYEQRAFYIDYPFNDRNNEYYDNEESLLIELFTGFYDKNGKKIYENDIVSYTTLQGKTLFYFITTNKNINTFQIFVISDLENFKLCNEIDISFLFCDLSNLEDIKLNSEVIGNIHNREDISKGLK